MLVYIALAEGFEEIEAVAVIDILRRAGIKTKTFSLTENRHVKGAHDVIIISDDIFEEIDFAKGHMMVLPGGMPGTINLAKHLELGEVLKEYKASNKWLAAICAAPTVLAKYGIIEGKNATCYPGCEKDFGNAIFQSEEIVIDGNIITSRGPGTALKFGIKLVELILGEEKANSIKVGMLIE